MRKIKKILLAFCVTAGIAALSACSAPQENAPKELDLGVTSAVSVTVGDGEGEPVFRHDPTREKGIQKSPQAFLNPE